MSFIPSNAIGKTSAWADRDRIPRRHHPSIRPHATLTSFRRPRKHFIFHVCCCIIRHLHRRDICDWRCDQAYALCRDNHRNSDYCTITAFQLAIGALKLKEKSKERRREEKKRRRKQEEEEDEEPKEEEGKRGRRKRSTVRISACRWWSAGTGNQQPGRIYHDHHQDHKTDCTITRLTLPATTDLYITHSLQTGASSDHKAHLSIDD